MIATSTLSIRTEIAPRWISFIGYALAAALLLTYGYYEYILLLFPLWVLLLSTYILIQNLHIAVNKRISNNGRSRFRKCG